MNPSVFDVTAPVAPTTPAYLRRAMKVLWRCLALLFRDMLRRRGGLKIEDGPPVKRVGRAIAYRMSFVPLVAVLFVLALVYAGTRPTPVSDTHADPRSAGVYFENVDYVSSDGVRVQAWLAPAIDARSVLQSGMSALTTPRPAVILAHGLGATREQLLPLVKPLHEAGFVVMVVALRGSGTTGAVAQSFGVNESLDVLASIGVLKRQAFVDPARIALLGVGTGANAVLLAADREPGVWAVVVDGPVESGDAAVRRWVGPRAGWLAWVDPFCKFTLEMSLGQDIDDLGLSRLPALARRVPTLVLGASGVETTSVAPASITDIDTFLRSRLARVADAHAGATASAGDEH